MFENGNRFTLLLISVWVSASPAHAGPYRKVVCQDGETVFVPKRCSREFQTTTRDLYASLQTEVQGTEYTVEVGSESIPLAERLDQLNLELQTHYVGMCTAFVRTPCDTEARAQLNAVTARLPEIYAEVRSGIDDPTRLSWLENDLAVLIEQLGHEDVVSPSLTGSWSIISTQVNNGCTPMMSGPVESIWKVLELGDGSIEVRVSGLEGQQSSAYPVLSGSLSEAQTLKLRGTSTDGQGWTSITAQVSEKGLSGVRKVEGGPCVYEYRLTGSQ